ncbi:hypothetical protein ACIRBX_16155 [Kitasatospora sp. NPDC096147]|uniref:hypothetical protein n=1 Tax=Kitasatospora sp. NPDC096147 TaxID=3364093 RepID=UPI0037FA610B
MAVIALVGGPGAPGVTTGALALLLSWPLHPGRRVLLVECDPDGGAVLAGALEGRVEAVYGLRNLAVADRRGLLGQAIWDQLVDISPDGTGERLLLPGLTDPAQAPGLAYTWEPLVEALHALEPQGYDVLLDLGRSGAYGPGAVLARRADAVVVTVRSTLRGLSSARPRLNALREDLTSAGSGPDALGVLLVAEGPYPAAEIAREFGVPVLGVLPHAPRTARLLSDGGDTGDRRFVRSELMRTARSAADQIQLLVRRRRQSLAPAAVQQQPAQAPQVAPSPDREPHPLAYQQPGAAQPYPVQPQPYPQQPYPQHAYQQPQPVPPPVPQPQPFQQPQQSPPGYTLGPFNPQQQSGTPSHRQPQPPPQAAYRQAAFAEPGRPPAHPSATPAGPAGPAGQPGQPGLGSQLGPVVPAPPVPQPAAPAPFPVPAEAEPPTYGQVLRAR